MTFTTKVVWVMMVAVSTITTTGVSALIFGRVQQAPLTKMRVATVERPMNASVDEMVASVTRELVDESCEVERSKECADEATLARVRRRLQTLVGRTAHAVEDGVEGDVLERGWEAKGRRSALGRNVEVWRKVASCAVRVLKARKSGLSEDKTAAAVFLRDSLLELGPTFVKLGQVLSTRTDVLPAEYTDVLKSLQDDVPGFSNAKALVEEELAAWPFSSFDDEPIAAASLGQVHKATLKDGTRVAVKVQRAGLRELFDVDLKNLRKLCELLDKVDPKSDGADRSYIDVFDESEKLLYEEIDYLNEAKNADRFRRENPNVKVPLVFEEFSTPRVLTMEYVDAVKMTDASAVEAAGIDRKVLAKATAESFLTQIIDSGYFHCDPHPGNLQVDPKTGKLVYYDFGMMDELKPNVRDGFQEFCFALFEGGPYVSELAIAQSAKKIVDAVEKMGVLAKNADRLACEQLARFFVSTFKATQRGEDLKEKGIDIKRALGAELQALTEAQVFRFPSTFTFIFRALASVDGIGKTLDPKAFDLSLLARPFVERLVETKTYKEIPKPIAIASKATGLNPADIETAITSPKKIQYLEDTVRAIEQGSLKIRVRSLENERALSRLAQQTTALTNLLVAATSLVLSQSFEALSLRFVKIACLSVASVFGLKALGAFASLAAADKKAARYQATEFEQGDATKP
ncbi:hypothetical protein CTAYLR_003082 [Chrysophaeum taylorii]|uniref:ABC1 atypical kinase-like domain-containing protein n=1 Tax=Chrysophaeum taylorii TaxID=2483200 RepID=A0AAD7U5J0_9STRA|nr:hypothetical protein CTAYLR_003082 [Chrysophaeum taylorii]